MLGRSLWGDCMAALPRRKKTGESKAKSASEPKPSGVGAAKLAIQRFWGGNGSDERLEVLRSELSGLSLSPDACHDLIAWLPQPGGLTQLNVNRAERLLARMAR